MGTGHIPEPGLPCQLPAGGTARNPGGMSMSKKEFGLCVLRNPLPGVFLHCLFKDAFSPPPEPAVGGTWAVFSPFLRFFPVSLPDWQQGGPTSRLSE